MRKNIEAFFALARAQSRRVMGVDSGDNVLERLPKFHPTAPSPLVMNLGYMPDNMVVPYLVACWWVGMDATLCDRIRPQFDRASGTIARYLDDLRTMVTLGITSAPTHAPLRKIPWQNPRMPVVLRSMIQVFEALIPVVGARDALHLTTIARHRLGSVCHDHDWAPIGGKAGAGLAWCWYNDWQRLHPIGANQETGLAIGKSLLEASKNGDLWPTEDHAWTIDSVMAWSEILWEYLKQRNPAWKDPWT